MSFLSKVGDFFTGGLGSTIVDVAKSYFPPDLSPEQVAQVELAVQKATQEHERKMMALAIEQDKMDMEKQEVFNNRIKQMEGTASDLKQFGILGKLVVFLRGMQRPFWGFATFYLDSRWLFGTNTFSEKQELALVLINMLVLVFLFGERAMKNVAPLIARILEAKK